MTDNLDPAQDQHGATTEAWKEIVLQYQKPSTARALWQIINTFVPLEIGRAHV